MIIEIRCLKCGAFLAHTELVDNVLVDTDEAALRHECENPQVSGYTVLDTGRVIGAPGHCPAADHTDCSRCFNAPKELEALEKEGKAYQALENGDWVWYVTEVNV